MDDDFADDEIENELAPINVQLAYVKHVRSFDITFILDINFLII